MHARQRRAFNTHAPRGELLSAMELFFASRHPRGSHEENDELASFTINYRKKKWILLNKGKNFYNFFTIATKKVEKNENFKF